MHSQRTRLTSGHCHSIILLNDCAKGLVMSSAEAKRVTFSAFAEVAKALAHSHRLEIIEHLAQGERSVEALAEKVGLSIANASQHLRVMRRAGLLASRRDGKRMIYRLSDSSPLEAVAAIRRVGERNLAEVRQ